MSADGAGVGVLLGWIGIGVGLMLAAALTVVFWPPTKREKERYRDLKWWQAQVRKRAAGGRVNLEPEAPLQQFRCRSCGCLIDVGQHGGTVREVAAEMGRLPASKGPPALVCDPCYRLMMGEDVPVPAVAAGRRSLEDQ